MSPIFPAFTRKEVITNWAKDQALLFIIGLLFILFMPGKSTTIPIYLGGFFLATILGGSLIFALSHKHFKSENKEKGESEKT